ncbi:Acg family FMN-binding oxidoreductase [Phytoactinopolyspora limicola]|uniref:Acg family FMN-binding oxidoreductase n=1 Tax=Phytoactinopolyspora limicola TaxID=2715536 RepID=UPI0014085576|nr:nitroreductase family protein [Phytoactinopolyspora limicola]
MNPYTFTAPLAARLTSAALAAPSMHNSQPWVFRQTDAELEIWVDHTRLLPMADPDGRGLYLATGAAVFNARLAALALGYEPRVRLRPIRTEPALLATITVVGPAQPSFTQVSLAQNINRRRTNRRPFRNREIPTNVVTSLAGAARSQGGTLRALGYYKTAQVLGVVRQADRIQRTDPRYLAELAHWTHPTNGRRDGIPAAAVGPKVRDRSLPLPDLGLALPADTRPTSTFEESPAVFALSTTRDDPAAWLSAGMALQCVLLAATNRSINASFMFQPMRVPELHSRLRRLIDPRTYPQMTFRLGYGYPVPATPRRSVADVLDPGPEPQ